MLAALLVALTLGFAPPAVSVDADYTDHTVVRVHPRDHADVIALRGLSAQRLSDHEHVGPMVLLLEPGGLAALDVTGVPHDVITLDAAGDIARTRERLARRERFPAASQWFTEFRDNAEIEAYTDELVAMASDRAKVVEIGQTLEGRPIRAVELSTRADNPAVLLLGTQHSREWLSPMAMMYFLERLVVDYGADDTVDRIVDGLDVIIVPVHNVDGYLYTWSSNRFWRKNRRGSYGVDLNRNWGAGWGIGTSSMPQDSEIYPGSAAFSEPETAVVRDYVLDRGDLVAFVDYHTPISSVLYPYGFTPEPPDQIEWLEGWAHDIADAATAVHGEKHVVFRPTGPDDPIGQTPMGGLSQDWFTHDAGALGWIMEMRGPDFDPPPSAIMPGCEENWAGFVALADHVLVEFGSDDDGDDDGTGTGDGGGDDDDDDDDASDDDPTGCGCSVSSGGATGLLAWVLACGLMRRRRGGEAQSRA